MNNKLFVGGIAWATTNESLREAFEQAGTVEDATILTDRDTGRSRGFGFVTMSSEAEAQAAIEMWDGKELDGRAIKVNVAKPREER
jgi:cold-inducible RNA-binding protein